MLVDIYGLCDPVTGVVRYVGKSSNTKRRLLSHLQSRTKIRTPLYLWINSLKEEGKSPDMKVLETCEEVDWPKREVAVIAEYRARNPADQPLLNLADGGNGVRNSWMTRENRKFREMCGRFVRLSDIELRDLADFAKDLKNKGKLPSCLIENLQMAAFVCPEYFAEWADDR